MFYCVSKNISLWCHSLFLRAFFQIAVYLPHTHWSHSDPLVIRRRGGYGQTEVSHQLTSHLVLWHGQDFIPGTEERQGPDGAFWLDERRHNENQDRLRYKKRPGHCLYLIDLSANCSFPWQRSQSPQTFPFKPATSNIINIVQRNDFISQNTKRFISFLSELPDCDNNRDTACNYFTACR